MLICDTTLFANTGSSWFESHELTPIWSRVGKSMLNS